jgi:hypothetical protein
MPGKHTHTENARLVYFLIKPDLKSSTFASNDYNGYNYILYEQLVLPVIDFMCKLRIGHLE